MCSTKYHLSNRWLFSAWCSTTTGRRSRGWSRQWGRWRWWPGPKPPARRWSPGKGTGASSHSLCCFCALLKVCVMHCAISDARVRAVLRMLMYVCVHGPTSGGCLTSFSTVHIQRKHWSTLPRVCKLIHVLRQKAIWLVVEGQQKSPQLLLLYIVICTVCAESGS